MHGLSTAVPSDLIGDDDLSRPSLVQPMVLYVKVRNNNLL